MNVTVLTHNGNKPVSILKDVDNIENSFEELLEYKGKESGRHVFLGSKTSIYIDIDDVDFPLYIGKKYGFKFNKFFPGITHLEIISYI